MSVAAVIVNYHTSDYLPDLVNDLAGYDEVEQVFVVDNSGEVEPFTAQLSRGDCREGFSGVEIIKPGKNIGFGAGVNLAADRASSEYLLVINPDVRLFPGCLKHLLAGARRYGALLTGPRFFWDEAKRYRLPPSQGACPSLDFAFETAGSSRLEFEHISFCWQMRHDRFWSSTTPFTEIFLSGACVLIHREWAVKSGSTVFDERFFLYFEDNDISLRAHFDGVPPLCIPAAEALHHYDQSPAPERSKAELMGRSHGQFSRKYYGNLKYLLKKSGSYLPEITDMGQVSKVLSFNLDMFEPAGDLYFEMGVNPFFVPFAQTTISTAKDGSATSRTGLFSVDPDITVMDGHGSSAGLFVPDEAVWSRLAKGSYYGRIRDSIKGVLKIWKWEKV